MTKDEIIKIAQKVTGVSFPLGVKGVSIGMNEKHLQDFANAIMEAEREACAKLMDDMAAKDNLSNYYKVAANKIRAREQE
jgi:hypothetical protein